MDGGEACELELELELLVLDLGIGCDLFTLGMVEAWAAWASFFWVFDLDNRLGKQDLGSTDEWSTRCFVTSLIHQIVFWETPM